MSASLSLLICLRAPRVGATGQGAHAKGVGLEIVDPRVAAIDVGNKIVAVAVRTPGQQPGQRQQQLRKFKTFYPVVREVVGWLVAQGVTQGVTQVAMEATGVDWRPVFPALCEAEQVEVLLVNARHVKNVPGRRTDAEDAEWLAERCEVGLRGSCIPRPRSPRSGS